MGGKAVDVELSTDTGNEKAGSTGATSVNAHSMIKTKCCFI
jgi:hypothetical protein